jgi:L-serine dehydratase
MAVSCFDLFKIGIGPSSSHTVGPMRAARLFVLRLQQTGQLAQATRLTAQLYGSLGATGKGHGTDKAVLLGLAGFEPDTVDVDAIPALLQAIADTASLVLLGQHKLPFKAADDLKFYRRETLPLHANGMRFTAYDGSGVVLAERVFYSVGGGFVVTDELMADGSRSKTIAPSSAVLPLPFHSGADLLVQAHSLDSPSRSGSIAQVMRHNERHWRSDADIDAGLIKIWQVMQACVLRGCATDGVLPGGFKVKRRAKALFDALTAQAQPTHAAARIAPAHAPTPAPTPTPTRAIDAPDDPLLVLDWVNLFALAVNEENAAGGRVVTAPTNGAAGIVPAVLHYYVRFVRGATDSGVIDFLLTAAAIGLLYKENASISGAEVGCQGEVGVACSMAAAALCAVMGGTPEQVENAAEIGMEHHLGLTCDPVGGLVQIPCIERNAIASVKAINAARMALRGDGTHFVSLDQVIKTMRETGADMMTKYKETARGGLAVNIVEC